MGMLEKAPADAERRGISVEEWFRVEELDSRLDNLREMMYNAPDVPELDPIKDMFRELEEKVNDLKFAE